MAQDDRFADLLSQIARETTRRQSSEVCCGDLTLEQFQTLRAVDKSDAASIGSLSAALRVDLSTMSRNISVLERNGYLVRVRSVEDARIVHVKLNAKGRRTLETLRCSERDLLKDLYERLSPGERSGVVKALESLRACFAPSSVVDGSCCSPKPARKSAS